MRISRGPFATMLPNTVSTLVLRGVHLEIYTFFLVAQVEKQFA
jgi:hypothetical protein